MSNAEVRMAAEYLDKYCKHTDWRSRISVENLRMLSTDNCVLGQVYGDYDIGRKELIERSSAAEWYNVSDAFGGLTEEWKEYLSDSPSTRWNGVKWYPNNGGTPVIYRSEFFANGHVRVTYENTVTNAYVTDTLVNFLKNFRDAPQFVEGRIYRGSTGDLFVYSATVGSRMAPGFYRISGINAPGWDYVGAYEDKYAPFVAVTGNGNMSGKHFDVKM